jgi:hypothetical protein
MNSDIKKIIVDIDGVLLPGKYQLFLGNRDVINGNLDDILFDPFAIRCLNIFCKYSSAKISISRTWEKHKSISDIKTIFYNNGFDGKFVEDEIIWGGAIMDTDEDHIVIKSDEDCFMDIDKESNPHWQVMVNELDGLSYSVMINILKKLGIDIGVVLEGEFF